MGSRLTGKLAIGCLVAAALAIPACDRTTPAAPDQTTQSAAAAWELGNPSLDLAPSQAPPLTLTEGGDVCIPLTAVTIILVKNTRLTCDTKCETTTTPCFQFGAPGIKLELNGHKVSGPAEPPANCETTVTFLPGDGIASFGQNDIVIHGPGLVEKFRRHGVALTGLVKAEVKKITSHHNCFSGVWLAANVRESLVEEIVSVRNAIASAAFPCGGLCITNSHNNRIRRSEFAGNGALLSGANDFGVGLVGNSSGNVIEENGIGGNINGILLIGTPNGNLIRKNVIVGNPPIQVGSPPVTGFDIRNLSTGVNRFEENLCITSTGNPPCPNLPQWAGHQNNG
jgi:Right handed beta helix region